jgi:hypothetical protein
VHYRATGVKVNRATGHAPARSVEDMIALIVILLILGIIFGVFGFVVKGLLWLAIIGILLFVISIIWGIVRRGVSRT